jgi:uracil-DNA glycosylase
MKQLLEELTQFLNWYKEIYSDQVYINGQWIEPVTHQGEVRAAVKGINRSSSAITKSLAQFNAALRDFYEEIKDCQKCRLGSTRKNFVFGVGNPNAKIMFVGEAPGREEDEQGIPFVGRAGQLLSRMLASIGLSRDDVFIANVLKCRPPQNRDPLPEEIAHCEPYLKKQLSLISPVLIVALGRIAGQVLLRREDSLSQLRQTIHLYEKIPLIVTYHPAALLRNSQWKQQAWEDLKKMKKVLKN